MIFKEFYEHWKKRDALKDHLNKIYFNHVTPSECYKKNLITTRASQKGLRNCLMELFHFIAKRPAAEVMQVVTGQA